MQPRPKEYIRQLAILAGVYCIGVVTGLGSDLFRLWSFLVQQLQWYEKNVYPARIHPEMLTHEEASWKLAFLLAFTGLSLYYLLRYFFRLLGPFFLSSGRGTSL